MSCATEKRRRPDWLRVRLPGGPGFAEVKRTVRELRLNTVCEEASCPNLGECWGRRTMTTMILGDWCTRACRFCDVTTRKPRPADPEEPRRVAEALARLGLRYAVITSVARDDLPDGGAAHWAETIRRTRAACPEMYLEVLISDLQGDPEHIDLVLEAGPHVFGHNIETVRRLTPTVRSRSDYDRSLGVLAHAAARGAVVKSGMMLGLGEEESEVHETLRDLRAAGVQLVTLGQYLRPTRRHHEVARFVTPAAFDAFAAFGRDLGFSHVAAGPLVRSSYHADVQAHAAGLPIELVGLPPKSSGDAGRPERIFPV